MALTYRLIKGAPLTFKEGDDNLDYLHNLALSGSVIDIGSFATTASNSFKASQIVSGSVTVSGSILLGDVQALGKGDFSAGRGDTSFEDGNLTRVKLNYPSSSFTYLDGIFSDLSTLYKNRTNYESSELAKGYPVNKYSFILPNTDVISYAGDTSFSTSSIVRSEYTASAIKTSGMFSMDSSGSGVDVPNFGVGLSQVSNTILNANAITTTVNKIIEQPDGKILIAGTIYRYSGSQVSHFFRINADGTVDNTFLGNNTVGSGVKTMVTQSDGKIVAVGFFTSVLSGSSLVSYPARRIARFNSDGTIDTTFNPGAGVYSNYYTSPQSVAVQSDNKIILLGSGMGAYSGSSVSNIVRINENGTLDTSFVMGGGLNNAGYYTAIQADGKILVGGAFTTYSGSTCNRIVRINTDGTVDTSFNTGDGFNNYVAHIEIQPDQKIIIGGGFTSYSGSNSNYIIRLNTDGTIDTSFNIGTGFDNQIYSQNSIALEPNGKIVVFGIFTKFNGVTLPNSGQITRLNSDGTLDTTFSPNGVFTSLITNYNSSIARLSTGNILFGGFLFNGVQTIPAVYRGFSEISKLFLSQPITGSVGINTSEITNITFQNSASLSYVNLGTASLSKVFEGYIDDDPYVTVNTPFPVNFLGKKYNKIYVTGQGYIMFEMYPASYGTRMPNTPLINPGIPSYPNIKVAAADLSLYQVLTGSDASTFRLWLQERNLYPFGTPNREYSYIFYKDSDRIDLYIDSMLINPTQNVSAISNGSKLISSFNIYSGSAYALTIVSPEVTSSIVSVKSISEDRKVITAYGSASINAIQINNPLYSVILENRLHPNANTKKSYSIYDSQSLANIKIESVSYNPSQNETVITLSSSLNSQYTGSTYSSNFISIESNNSLDINVSFSSGSGSYISDYSDLSVYNYNAYNLTASSVDVYRNSGSGVAGQINLKNSNLLDDLRLLTASFSGSFLKPTDITSSFTFSSSYLPVGKSNTIAIGDYSQAVGLGIVASGSYQYIFGRYNRLNDDSSIFAIGSGIDNENRSTVLSATSTGVVISGSLTVTGNASYSNYAQNNIVTGSIIASVNNSNTSSFSIVSASQTLYEIKNTTQQIINSKFTASLANENFYRLTGRMTQPLTASVSDISAVRIDPIMEYTTGSQKQTALKVVPTFTGSFANSLKVSNKIAEFGDSKNGTHLIIDDVISGSIYSINDISGFPIFEVFSDSSLKIYDYFDAIIQKSGSAIYLGNQNNKNYKVVVKSDLVIDEGLSLTNTTTQVSQSISGSYTASLYNINFSNVSSSVYFKAIINGYDTGSWDVVAGDITGIIKYSDNIASLVGIPTKYSGSNNIDMNFDLVAGGTSASLQLYGVNDKTYKFAATVITQIY